MPPGPPTPPPPDPRFAGLDVPTPAFADDDGSPDPVLGAALAAHAAGPGVPYDVVAALLPGRLLVPVVAVLDEEETDGDGRRQDKSSHMATVTLVAPDGRRGLLAFSGTASLAAWREDARPVPVTAVAAAAAVLEEGADALLVDVAGPHRFALAGAGLRALAAGRTWLPASNDPAVAAAVAAVMAGFGAVVSARLDPCHDGTADVVVVLSPQPGHDAAEVPEVARRAAEALAADPVLRDRLERGLSLALET